jgi:putative addiction module CopG family antidote
MNTSLTPELEDAVKSKVASGLYNNVSEVIREALRQSLIREQAMAFFRSGQDPVAARLAIKGGTAAASHGQMDAESFVYDSQGIRWFHDLGKDD